MASSYMLMDRVTGYEVKVCNGRKIVERKRFRDYDAAMLFLDAMEDKYGVQYSVEFNTLYK